MLDVQEFGLEITWVQLPAQFIRNLVLQHLDIEIFNTSFCLRMGAAVVPLFFTGFENTHSRVDSCGCSSGSVASLRHMLSTNNVMLQSWELVLVFRQWKGTELYLGCCDSACFHHSERLLFDLDQRLDPQGLNTASENNPS